MKLTDQDEVAMSLFLVFSYWLLNIPQSLPITDNLTHVAFSQSRAAAWGMAYTPPLESELSLKKE